MKNIIKTSFGITLLALLSGCGSSEGGFTTGGSGSGSSIPAAAHFSLAYSEAPIAQVLTGDIADPLSWVWNVDHEVSIVITVGDNSDAKVNGGTVYFATDYGLLSASSCTLQAGECSVKWYSEGSSQAPSDYYATVTAWMMGEESYIDIDGSGNFNDGDVMLSDTAEPFVDTNHAVPVPPATYTISYDAGADEIIDVDNNGAHTPADGLFNGANCTHSTLCSSTTRIPIFDIIMMNLDARS